MPTIELTYKIQAPIELVFDLARSIDVHKRSAAHTNETAIAGRTSGLIQEGETVTWRAKHLGVYQTLTVRIAKMDSPTYFCDEHVSGAFPSFTHHHYFTDKGTHTLMRDVFQYQSPLGLLGRLADVIFLKRYMERFLDQRNLVIKELAEQER